MRKILFFLAVFVSIFYLSQNTIAGTVYGSIQTCYYGANCAQQGYSTPGEVYCSDWFATYEKGYPTCNYGAKCCGSLDYCSQVLWGSPQSVPSACTQAYCYYINQVGCTGGRVCSASGCICPSDKPNWDGTNCIACPSGTTWNDVEKKCKGPAPAACPDGTLEGACCTTPGTKCKNDGGTLKCLTDPTCPNCVDTDTANDPYKKGTCYDTVNSVCGFTSGGCTDTCASNGAVTEYYCAGSGTAKSCMPTTKSCSSSDVCSYGVCTSTPGYGGGGGCTWLTNFVDSNNNRICSSGCPPSYPNQQYTCCATYGSQCGGRPGCPSYNPIIGETPCCTASGYQTCTKQETCTSSGCVNICTTPGYPKDAEPYCSKCNSCQDGIQNCGEPSVDKCEAFCMF